MGYPRVIVVQLEYLRQTGMLAKYYDWLAKRVESYEVKFDDNGNMSSQDEKVAQVDFCRVLREDFADHFGERQVTLAILNHMINHTLSSLAADALPKPETPPERKKDYSELTRIASAPPPTAINQVLRQLGIHSRAGSSI